VGLKGVLDLLTIVAKINDFRNTYVAYKEKDLANVNLTRSQICVWINGLKTINLAS
jgi:hypothetical protein